MDGSALKKPNISHRDLGRLVKKGRACSLPSGCGEKIRRPHGVGRPEGRGSRYLRKKSPVRAPGRGAELRFVKVRLRKEIAARRTLEAELNSSCSALRHCLSSLLRSQDQERAWLASELYEGLGQSLAGIKLMIEAALDATREPESDDLRKSLESIVPLMGQSVEKLRRFGLALQPPDLDEWGVGAAISWLCERFADSHPLIRVRSLVRVPDLDDREPFRLYLFKLYLVRILQVALVAVARRGRANRVAVCLGQSPAGVELAIRDNDAEPARLPELAEARVLKEWAKRSGGNFRVAFQSQKGMLFQICWPLAPG